MARCFVVLILTAASAAHAQPVDKMGKFPLLEVGLVAGFSQTPIAYTSTEAHDNLSGMFGPDIIAHVDSGKLLLNLQGFYNVASSDTQWRARAQVVLGARTKHNVVKSITHSAPSGGYVTRTTEYYAHKHVPLVIGVSGGLTLLRANDVAYTSAFGDSNMRSAATVPLIDVGFTLQSPQIQLTVGPLLSATDGALGVHWELGMSFPVGKRSLFFKFSGDHLTGDDPLDNSGRRIGMVMLASLGIGGGYGVRL